MPGLGRARQDGNVNSSMFGDATCLGGISYLGYQLLTELVSPDRNLLHVCAYVTEKLEDRGSSFNFRLCRSG